jgi:hypothetical protein
LGWPHAAISTELDATPLRRRQRIIVLSGGMLKKNAAAASIGQKAAKEALDDRLAGQGFRPYACEGAGVAQGLARVGALVRVRKVGAANGASDTPGFPPMFRDRARGALSRMPIFAGSTFLQRLAPADQFGGSARRVDERHRDEGEWIAPEFFG